jgi:hypothetical protein
MRSGKRRFRLYATRSVEVSGRRLPWLSGLVVALAGAVSLMIEVGGGVVQLMSEWLAAGGM